jgi:hypothetical protein
MSKDRRLTLLWTLWAILCLVCGCGAGSNGSRIDSAVVDADGQDAEVVDAGPDAAPWDGGPVPDGGPLVCEQGAYYAQYAMRLSSISIPSDGQLDRAFDVDDSTATCAPVGLCSGGADNQLGAMDIVCPSFTMDPPFINNSVFGMMLNLESGPANWLVEMRGLTLDATGTSSIGPFELRLYQGTWIASGECTDATQVQDSHADKQCDYLVDEQSFEPGTCTPVAVLDNAEINQGVLTAGGDNYNMPLTYRFQTVEFGFPMHRARMRANVEIDTNLGRIRVRTGGILGGVICPFDFASMVNELMSVDPAECDVLSKLPPADLETGCGPDNPDGISAAMIFRSVPARLVGYRSED